MIKRLLGNKIRTLRTQRGYSQEKFALRIGIDRTYLASVESGQRNISINNIVKIANGFEMSLEEFFKGL